MKLGNWHEGIGTSRENSPNREAPNRHVRGTKKYKEMIDRDSKRLDKYGNLPFTFSKPPKRTRPREDIFHVCELCQHISLVSKFRVGQTCPGCCKYTSVNETNTFHTEDDLEKYLESFTHKGEDDPS